MYGRVDLRACSLHGRPRGINLPRAILLRNKKRFDVIIMSIEKSDNFIESQYIENSLGTGWDDRNNEPTSKREC